MIDEKKFYLTKEGLQRLKREYEELKNIKFAKTKGESPKVLHSEDLNPEYLAFQEDLNFLESRIIELENILKNSELIAAPPKNLQSTVTLGATVTTDIDGELNEFTIVGTLEADPGRYRISNESPIGKCLMGKKIGEDVVVKASIVNHTCKIIKIKYDKI